MHIVFCDDHADVIAKYQRIVEDICVRHKIDATFDSYKSGESLLFSMEEIILGADIIFLDVRMPGRNGIEVASVLRENGYGGEIIFLTLFKDAVYYAFDVRANNYLLKETATLKRIEKVFLDAVEIVREKNDEFILLTGIGEYRNVPIKEIRYFEVNQKIVTVYYGHRNFEFVSTIGKLENILFNKGFIRISRSYLVAKKYIRSFVYGKVFMMDGEELPVGRKYYKELKNMMKNSVK